VFTGNVTLNGGDDSDGGTGMSIASSSSALERRNCCYLTFYSTLVVFLGSSNLTISGTEDADTFIVQAGKVFSGAFSLE
jgi:hypothetical protein